jgi:Protein of unknown function (DUF3830)
MSYIDIQFAAVRLRARLLADVAPVTTAAFRNALPLEGRAFQDQYSAQIMRITSRLEVDAAGDRTFGYQHAGLVMLDPTTSELALCFGRGRLQNSLGPIGAIPIAEVGGDLTELNLSGDQLQFEGAQPIHFSLSADQESPLADPPLNGQHIVLTLAGSRAEAVLLEDISPKAAAAFAAVLPLTGKATNTYASGPLTRFWNSAGGPQGETPLEVPDNETSASTLYGGGYYLSTPPWRGIRIAAQEPTAMGGGRSLLAPVFRFVGDWSAFAALAATLTMDGQKELGIELAP